jgi:CRP-like cAMP-binding protein
MHCIALHLSLVPVYTFAMATHDLQARLQPWLDRWSLRERDDLDQWLARMAPVSFDTEQYLVRAGDHGDTLYLLERGLVRLYYVSPDGKERNKAFFAAGEVTGPVSAAMTGSPAPFAIQALEPTEAIAFHYHDLLAVARQRAEINQLVMQLLSNAFIRNEQREAMLLTLNAQQRYAWLCEHEPDLIERVPQFHIASYIGVDAVTLSRLKRKVR